jgi:hypothetical protein
MNKRTGAKEQRCKAVNKVAVQVKIYTFGRNDFRVLQSDGTFAARHFRSEAAAQVWVEANS